MTRQDTHNPKALIPGQLSWLAAESVSSVAAGHSAADGGFVDGSERGNEQ
jgi:hypothetical protein